MRQITFGEHRPVTGRGVRIFAGVLIVLGAIELIVAYLPVIPEQASLDAVSGKIESVTHSPGRYTKDRYLLDVRTNDGRAIRGHVDAHSLGTRAQDLDQKPVVMQLARGYWVMSLQSGGRQILTYENARRAWEKDKSWNFELGIGFFSLGLVLAAFHAFRVIRRRRRRSLSSRPTAAP